MAYKFLAGILKAEVVLALERIHSLVLGVVLDHLVIGWDAKNVKLYKQI